MVRQAGVAHGYSVLAVEAPGAYHLTVGRVHLGGKPADGVLQLVYGRHVAYPAIPYSSKRYQYE